MVELVRDFTGSRVVLRVYISIGVYIVSVALAPNSRVSPVLLRDLPCQVLLVSMLVEFFNALMSSLSLAMERCYRLLFVKWRNELAYNLGSIGICCSKQSDCAHIISQRMQFIRIEVERLGACTRDITGGCVRRVELTVLLSPARGCLRW